MAGVLVALQFLVRQKEDLDKLSCCPDHTKNLERQHIMQEASTTFPLEKTIRSFANSQWETEGIFLEILMPWMLPACSSLMRSRESTLVPKVKRNGKEDPFALNHG